MVIEGDSYALTRATTAILVELLKQMDGAKRLALIDRAAEALEKGPNPGGQSTAAAIRYCATNSPRFRRLASASAFSMR